MENIQKQLKTLREMKSKGIVMEMDQTALTQIRELQESIRTEILQKYGPPPYIIQMTLEFPESMREPTTENINCQDLETITIQLASIEHVPYSVYYFLENIIKPFDGGVFHRNAPHVLQARLNGGKLIEPFAFQEYSPECSHLQYTIGYAGRPSTASHIYISTRDNSKNHGPGSQGSKTEADCIVGTIIGGMNDIKVIERMKKQPGASKKNGSIEDPNNHIQIIDLRIREPTVP
jgi:hypothetical protein